MNDTILRLNETNDKLQKENKLLRAKTKKESDTDDDDEGKSNFLQNSKQRLEQFFLPDDYKKMQKDELIKVVLRLEKVNLTNFKVKFLIISPLFNSRNCPQRHPKPIPKNKR